MEKIRLVEQTFTRKDSSITIQFPNVRYAKENDLLRKAIPMTYEIISYNMELCGFDVVSYGEPKGTVTKITAKCCNVDCDNTNEKTYNNFITNERYPLCKSCQSIVKMINSNNKRPILAINGAERIKFESVAEVAKQLGSTNQTIYHCVRDGRTHSSGYRFVFLD
ncbi:hypothetical protein COL39_12945 [Bacillus cereus]|uniref:hypothetical protein n=1 Tax=Bacillus cereus TaxID=1396 RepID=UPI000BF2727E|nr:hypothetical protein [Bacillus cereus]PFX73737.1 hypothetical protein COL39_12945 [Bacillus cereus]